MLKYSSFKIMEGIVREMNTKTRRATVQTVDDRTIECRILSTSVSNSGARQIANIEPDTSVIVLLMYTSDEDHPEGLVVGGYENLGTQGKLGASDVRERDPEDLPPGTMGFVGKHGEKILLYPESGLIEIVSEPLLKIILDPQNGKLKIVSPQLDYYKGDPLNYIQWQYHPKDEDLSRSYLHLGVHGAIVDDITHPDIQILAGDLSELPEDLIGDGVEYEGGSRVIMKVISNQGEDSENLSILEVGDLNVTDDDGESPAVAILRTNNCTTVYFADGSYSVSNDNTEIKANNDGLIVYKCIESTLGSREAELHQTLAETAQARMEEICDQITALVTAIETMVVGTTGPGGPTVPGPMNAPAFAKVKSDIAAIKAEVPDIVSTVHRINL